jgi:hypothetical protein
LSPILFNVYLEDAILKAPSLRQQIEIGFLKAYADDVLIEISTPELLGNILDDLASIGSSH